MSDALNTTPCLYALLRFRPFVETGEFAIVGLALLAPQKAYFNFRIDRQHSRVTNFFPQLNTKLYSEGRKRFIAELERFKSLVARIRETNPGAMEQTKRFFSELTRPREGTWLFDDQRIILSENPEATLNQLYEHYVERHFVTKAYQEKLLEKEIKRYLVEARVDKQYHSGEIGANGLTVNFPFVFRVDGQPSKIIKPLHLAYTDSTQVFRHGGTWVDRFRRLHRRQVLPRQILVPIAIPEKNSDAYGAFEEIQGDLQDLEIQVLSANDEAKIQAFALSSG